MTKVFGASDDLIEFEGNLSGEVSVPGTEECGSSIGVLLAFSDGTILSVRYGKGGQGVWGFTVLRKGDLYIRKDECDDPDADPYSDIVYFGDGRLKAWAAREAEPVK